MLLLVVKKETFHIEISINKNVTRYHNIIISYQIITHITVSKLFEFHMNILQHVDILIPEIETQN